MSGGSPPAVTLWSDAGTLKKYDMVLLACECNESPEEKPAAALQALFDYTTAGGRAVRARAGDDQRADPPRRRGGGGRAGRGLLPVPCPQGGAVGAGGGGGGALSGVTHDDRSNSMNSSAFSWAERSVVTHPLGKVLPA